MILDEKQIARIRQIDNRLVISADGSSFCRGNHGSGAPCEWEAIKDSEYVKVILEGNADAASPVAQAVNLEQFNPAAFAERFSQATGLDLKPVPNAGELPAVEEIRAMPAGPDLNRLIAQHVMGDEFGRRDSHQWGESVDTSDFHTLQGCAWCFESRFICICKADEKPKAECYREAHGYSTDIAWAWRVVEKMRADGWFYQLGDVVETPEHVASFHRPDRIGDGIDLGESLPLAICRAALIAVALRSA